MTMPFYPDTLWISILHHVKHFHQGLCMLFMRRMVNGCRWLSARASFVLNFIHKWNPAIHLLIKSYCIVNENRYLQSKYRYQALLGVTSKWLWKVLPGSILWRKCSEILKTCENNGNELKWHLLVENQTSIGITIVFKKNSFQQVAILQFEVLYLVTVEITWLRWQIVQLHKYNRNTILTNLSWHFWISQ